MSQRVATLAGVTGAAQLCLAARQSHDLCRTLHAALLRFEDESGGSCSAAGCRAGPRAAGNVNSGALSFPRIPHSCLGAVG